ncbi:ribonuclease N [Nocardioides marmoriginsengisoli]|uniref:Ribonuclease N n=1 Tax=Nocardioides marmoriginsengisoli TaxID=661483 RepID=A0A3N0CQ47_9ACTN|nr:ribonuclease domain-containing protein [Nocardioides marmoriginsengisoli]RNL65023.1 ribonuclease N [Nocardioides marmoriginsengisoli]
MNQRTRGVLALIGLVVVVVALIWARGNGPDLGSGGDAGARPTSAASETTTPVGSGQVGLSTLPRDARATVALIDRGGPFPYARDGITFRNAERLLPRQPTGYYREYTVPTPGSSDRGARRIVAGEDGTLYYTDDHYRSFREIVRTS